MCSCQLILLASAPLSDQHCAGVRIISLVAAYRFSTDELVPWEGDQREGARAMGHLRPGAGHEGSASSSSGGSPEPEVCSAVRGWHTPLPSRHPVLAADVRGQEPHQLLRQAWGERHSDSGSKMLFCAHKIHARPRGSCLAVVPFKNSTRSCGHALIRWSVMCTDGCTAWRPSTCSRSTGARAVSGQPCLPHPSAEYSATDTPISLRCAFMSRAQSKRPDIPTMALTVPDVW
jgi:hypothetical protein